MGNIYILQANIADTDTDAIVNATNERLLSGTGVSEAIYQKAGYLELLFACMDIGHCDTGSAIVTPGFHLKSKYIIHTVGPKWFGGTKNESELLSSCYQTCLETAERLKCASITFPLISAGYYRYPVQEAWEVALRSCQEYLNIHGNSCIQKILFCVIDSSVLITGLKVLASLKAKTAEEKPHPAQEKETPIHLRHKVFGEGILKQIDEEKGFIFVSFADGEKKFQYPQSVQSGFLTFVESNLQDKAMTDEPISKVVNLPTKITKTSPNNIKWPYLNALREEIEYIKAHPPKPILFSEIYLIEKHGSANIYAAISEDDVFWPVGSIVHLHWGVRNEDATLLAVEGNILYLRMTANLLNASLVEARVDSWFLLEKLKERFVETCCFPSACVQALLTCGNPTSKILTGQSEAIQLSYSKKASFVWGPPGTGKTETLAQIAISHMQKGQRILMVSYSNVSVDGAILRLIKKCKNAREGQILRYGFPRDKALANSSSYYTPLFVAKKNSDLLEKINEIKKKIADLNSSSFRYEDSKPLMELKMTLDDLLKQRNNEVRYAVHKAQFVATTVSKAVADPAIYEQRFDVVLFDEASMAYVPQVVFAAQLAKENFVCFGDFQQLPPIVQSGTESVLNDDIYELMGISSLANHGCPRDNVCLLETQYRMHSEIAEFSSKYMYSGMIRTGENVNQENQGTTSSNPFPNQAMVTMDTSGMLTICGQSHSNSHYNILDAFLSFAMAVIAVQENKQVGIITPYRDQANLLSRMAKDLYGKAKEQDLPVQCSTVHQFQGSEKDVIVFDTVDCYRQTYPGILLTSKKHSIANRLLNVALTRSKGKLITVCNIDFMKVKGVRPPLLLGHLLDNVPSINYKIYCEELSKLDSPFFSFYPKHRFAKEQFIRDLRSAKRSIKMDIPYKMAKDDKKLLSETESVFAEALASKKQIKIRLEDSANPSIPEFFTKLGVENTKAMYPLTIIDNEIIWYGMLPEATNFKLKDGEILPTTGRPVFRFAGKGTAKKIIEYLDMENTMPAPEKPVEKNTGYSNFANFIAQNYRCKHCGNPMQLKKGPSGKHFLSCTVCYGRIENIKKEDIEKYLFSKPVPVGSFLVGMECPYDSTTLLPFYNIQKGKWEVRCSAVHQHAFDLDQI